MEKGFSPRKEAAPCPEAATRSFPGLCGQRRGGPCPWGRHWSLFQHWRCHLVTYLKHRQIFVLKPFEDLISHHMGLVAIFFREVGSPGPPPPPPAGPSVCALATCTGCPSNTRMSFPDHLGTKAGGEVSFGSTTGMTGDLVEGDRRPRPVPRDGCLTLSACGGGRHGRAAAKSPRAFSTPSHSPPSASRLNGNPELDTAVLLR